MEILRQVPWHSEDTDYVAIMEKNLQEMKKAMVCHVIRSGSEQVCLNLENVWFSYGAHTVLEDVSLSIRQNELVGIAGPNGSGKSTLMKIMVGLLKPDKGTVSFTCHIDECEGMTPCRPCIGYVPQNPVIRQERFPVTAREVIEMGTFGQIGLFRRMNADSKKAVDNAITEAGLDYCAA